MLKNYHTEFILVALFGKIEFFVSPTLEDDFLWNIT